MTSLRLRLVVLATLSIGALATLGALWRVDTPNIVDEAVTASKLGYAPDAVVVVQRGATDLASGTNLKAAYAAAKLLTPGGNALAADNRAVVIAFGNYDFGAVALDLDTEFVDLIGEGICRCDRDPAITWTGAPYASAVSAIDLANAIFHWPDSHLICDTDEEVVNVTCRDVLVKGFLIEQETAGKDGLRIDNADACDRGRFIDLGFKMAVATDEAIMDGTETEIASYFENCHTEASLLGDCVTLSGSCKHCTGGEYSFCCGTASGTFIDCMGMESSFGSHDGIATGTFIDCIGEDSCFGFIFMGASTASGTFRNCIGGIDCFAYGGTASGTFRNCIGGIDSFGGASGTASGTFVDCIGGYDSFGGVASSPAALMLRCKSLGRSGPILVWQGTMIDCDIEVVGAGKDAVELAANLLGAGTETADASSTTTNINIVDKDVTANFPVGSFVKHVGQGTWHRITASVFSDPDTDLTVSPAAGADWDAEEVRAQTAPRIINCRLICTAEAIDADAETPCLVDGVLSNKDWDDTDCVNMIGAAANRFDEEHLEALNYGQ